MNRRLWAYVLITYGVSFAFVGGLYLAGVTYEGTIGLVMAITYMMIPALVAIGMHWKAGESIRDHLWIRFNIGKWWLVALTLPVGLAFFALLFSLLMPGVGFDPEMNFYLELLEDALTAEELAEAQAFFDRFPWPLLLLLNLAQAIGFGATVNAVAGTGEELGWRGFMLRELAAKGFWTSSLIIGVAWGFWHAPLILQGHNYPEYPLLGVFLMTLFCILLSPLFSWVTVKCRSAVAAGVMHGVFNASAGFSIIYLSDHIEPFTGIMGLLGLASLAVANLVLFVWARPSFDDLEWFEEVNAE